MKDGAKICIGNQIQSQRIEEIRQATIYGVRPKRTFRQAATKYLNESRKVSIDQDALHLKILDPFIGKISLDRVNINTLQPFIEARKKDGVKSRTVNYGLQTVRQILHAASREWVDENGMTWLASAPKIKLIPLDDVREPYPLSWDEQETFFKELPEHLARMALFKVNTGTREQEVCGLKWEWEVDVPDINPAFS